MELIKIQKYFTDCGVMSRRAAEIEIQKGNVLVNGKKAEIGLRIDPSCDVVEYLGKEVKPTSEQNVYIILNKPRGIVTTMSDEKGRTSVAELVKDVGARVYPVGRLDMDSDGLLLFTNDGTLANTLTHPRHDIPKIYRVTVAGAINEEQLAVLRSPLLIDGYKILPVKVDVISKEKQETVLEMTLYEGRNRQIRKMCEMADIRITRLCRIAIGEIKLGELKIGKWRFLTDKEVALLIKKD